MKIEISSKLFSVEAEAEVVGCALNDPKTMDDSLEIVALADFYNINYRAILAHCQNVRESQGDLEPSAVITMLNDSELIPVAVELASNSTGHRNVKVYASIIAERAKLRRLREGLQDSIEHSLEAESTDEAVEYAQSRLSDLENRDAGADIEDSDSVMKRALQLIDQRFRDRQEGIIGGTPTNLQALDERWNGMRDGHLIILAARPSMGKSALAMQIAADVAVRQRLGVLIFSLEMPSEEIHERNISNLGMVPYNRIRNGDLVEQDWPKITSAVVRIKGAPMWTHDKPGTHINQMKAYARKVHRRNPLKLIVVDHIGIAQGDGKERHLQVGSITRGLKSLAKELHCTVLALCQLNRLCEQRSNKRPMLSDLRESGDIEQDADIVTFMYRDEYYNVDSQDKGIVELNTAKFRSGEVGTDHVINKLQFMRIENMDGTYVPPKAQATKAISEGLD